MMYRPFSVRAALAVLVCILSVGAASVVTKLTEDVKATPGNQRWALLIAGSRGWGNYRHQADVCHAYHTLRRGGVPKEQIIVMMADDIANSTHNPQKGVIINRPGGPNVYPGVVMDYTGTQVTAKNMLRVLAGDAEAMQGIGSGKVLATGPGDMVFVYYADHGGTLVLGTPSGPFLRAHDLVDTLKAKAAKSGFRKMTLYVEACESGSIFSGLLPGNLSIYVTTAANQTESSWATYCPPHSGPLNVCLGDLYSVSWLENADVVDPRETLEAQYEAVKARTADRPKEGIRGSHVMQWGQLNYTDESIGDFTGYEENREERRSSMQSARGNVRQHDADLLQDFYKYTQTDDEDVRSAALRDLYTALGHRIWIEDAAVAVVKALVPASRHRAMLHQTRQAGPSVDDRLCFSDSLSAWEQCVGSASQYSMRYAKVFANLCNEGVSAKQVVQALQQLCQPPRGPGHSV